MTRAFKRIPASLVKAFLEGGITIDDFPQLEEALEAAVERAIDKEKGDGEAVIEAFIVDDSDDEEEDAA